MKSLVALVTALLIAVCAHAVDTTVLRDPALQARYLSLTHELRCMQCQNQTIADSPVGLASDLRDEVRDMLLAGKSDDEIRDFMVARYGEFILFRPRFSLRNAWLWLLPVGLLLLGGAFAMRIVRERAKLVELDEQRVDEDAQA